MTVLCYTYEADVHCASCAFARFGDMLDRDDAIDGEGNPVHAMLDGEEWYANDVFEGNDTATLGCGTCGEVIEEIDLS